LTRASSIYMINQYDRYNKTPGGAGGKYINLIMIYNRNPPERAGNQAGGGEAPLLTGTITTHPGHEGGHHRANVESQK
jgi:hypothetical protein